MTHHPKPDPPKGKAMTIEEAQEFVKHWLWDSRPFGQERATRRMPWDREYVHDAAQMIIAASSPPVATPETEAKGEAKGLKLAFLHIIPESYDYPRKFWTADNVEEGYFYPAASVNAILAEKDAEIGRMREQNERLRDRPGIGYFTTLLGVGVWEEVIPAITKLLDEKAAFALRLAEARRQALEEAARAAENHFDCDCQPSMVKAGLHKRNCNTLYGEIIADIIRNLSDGGEGEVED